MLMGAMLLGLMAAAGVGPDTGAVAGALESLEAGQRLADFTAEAVYDNGAGRAAGVRLRHIPSGFVLDLMRVDSVPQALLWVNTPPVSDRGEPHTLEHLLLGKGKKGSFVASLEDMSLGESSAFTQQRRTCYHFHTTAGPDVFFTLFEAKLDAMLAPDFSDEEIRREVCNMGIVDAPDGSLRLEEKGTVYTEMVSSFEKPGGNLYRTVGQLLYGELHPLALCSGGFPDAIRLMTPAHLRTFHAQTHHLNSMGAVVSVPAQIDVGAALERLAAILRRVEPGACAAADPAAALERLPQPQPDAARQPRIVRFPHTNPDEPATLVLAWPPLLDLAPEELFLFELFTDLLASGPTSNLYRRFIDSRTRRMETGATAVSGWVDDDLGYPMMIVFSNLAVAECTEARVAEVRAEVLREIDELANMADGSPALAAFNERARNRLIERRRDLGEFLNAPPRFGYRGTGSAWIDHLQRLHLRGGGRRDLTQRQDFDAVESLLATDTNFWRARIARWGLVQTSPFAVAATPDPAALGRAQAARRERIATFLDALRRRYEVDAEQAAVARYRAEYDAATAAIEEELRKVQMPAFIDSPPMTLDDAIQYRVARLAGGGPAVISTFDGITSGTAGLALRLDVLPDEFLVYVPILPVLLTDVGVIKDGQAIAYDAFRELLRREVLSLAAYFDLDYRTERVELVVCGRGANRDETLRALDWMETALFAPDLRPENLPRIRDVVDQALAACRDRMKRAEESWVSDPAYAYWQQANPLLLEAGLFLSQAHALQRVRWRLRDGGAGTTAALEPFLRALAAAAGASTRAELSIWLTQLIGVGPAEDVGAGPSLDRGESLRRAFGALSPEAREHARAAAKDLRQCLSDIPDASLAADIGCLCEEMLADLAVPPERALGEIEAALRLVRHRDNGRAFIVSNRDDPASILERLAAMVDQLDAAASVRQLYADRTRLLVAERVAQREGGAVASRCVALVNENTRSGVHVHMADQARYGAASCAERVRFLAGRLYGGGGVHSLFMKTWAAGLAYSNGLRSSVRVGRLMYYAERCPDLVQTMQFVLGVLRQAPEDPGLVDYAIAQAFGESRAGARYEQRGEGLARDLADGIDPSDVRAFREGILGLRRRPELCTALHAAMPQVCGLVMPGLGAPDAAAALRADAILFVIGPTEQLDGWEAYLRSVDASAVLQRLYPRDFWICGQP